MHPLDKISINFILSTARTGSTLLSSMLNMHEEILSTVEEPFAYNLYQSYHNVVYWTDDVIESYCDDFFLFSNGKLELQFGKRNDLAKILKEHQSDLNIVNAIKLSYFAFFPDKDKKNITTLVDKQLHFHFYLDEIFKYYPTAKFIVLIRDPRDTILLKQKYALKNKKNKNIYTLAKSWDFVYSVIINKLNKVDRSKFLIVKYEDLVSNPEFELHKICNFLNVKFNESLLNSHETAGLEFDLKINKLDKKKQQQYTTDIKSLTEKVNVKKIGIWETELSKKQSDLIWSICGNTATKYNYQQGNSKKIFYSNFLYKDFYINYILKKYLIANLYKLMPIKFRVWIKKRKK